MLALHSLPGSRRTIFLDFDGQVVSGTIWNDQGVPVRRTPGWDPSGNGPGVLSADEQARVLEVWARVAEDFAPFDVDVTTADPGPAAITRAGVADEVYGVQVVVTTDPEARAAIDSCAGTCGGVASNGVFDIATDHARYQPTWVFPQALADNAKYVAEAVSHEVGHTFGLSHDDRSGDADNGYYRGHAGWAPIMGSSYAEPITQWSNGSFAQSLNHEDDLQLIAAGGAPVRLDEDGNDLPAPGATSYIASRTDIDTYRLEGCAGPLRVTADVAGAGPNLDVELRLLDLDLDQLGVADPVSATSGKVATGMGAELTRSMPDTPADYLLLVDGSGRDGTSPVDGYDDYGSVGAYRLAVSGCGITVGAPGAPGVPSVTFSGTTAALRWTPPVITGDAPVTAYDVLVDGVRRTRVTTPSAAIAGLARGRAYRFDVAAVNALGAGVLSGSTARVPAVRPSAPRAVRASPGARGGAVSARVSWVAPATVGGAALTQYKIAAYRLNRRGKVVQALTPVPLPARLTSIEVRVPRRGTYRFAVYARNAVGWSPVSALSGLVAAR